MNAPSGLEFGFGHGGGRTARIRAPAQRAQTILTLAVATMLLSAPAQAQDAGASKRPALRPSATENLRDPGAPLHWRFSARGGVDLSMTDNVFLTSTGRKTDYITTPTASFDLTNTGAHATFNSNASASYDIYTRNSSLNGPRFSALMTSTFATASEDFSITSRAATRLQSASQDGTESATERSGTGNETQTLTYGASPKFQTPIGDIMRATARYDFSGVGFLKPATGSGTVAASNTFTHRADATLASGDRFARLTWTLHGALERTAPTSKIRGAVSSANSRRTADASLNYILISSLSLVATGGYERLHQPTLTDQLGSAYGTLGLIWQPSRRTYLRADAGYRYGRGYFSGNLIYQVTPKFQLTASYTQSIETPQSVLSNNLQGLVRNSNGTLIDPATGLVPDPTSNLFELTNQAFRRDVIEISANGRINRNFYTMTGSYERRNANGVMSKSWSGNAEIGRHLTPRLSASLTGRYTNTNPGTTLGRPPVATLTKTLTTAFDYKLGRTVSISLSHIYLDRTAPLAKYRENSVVLSLQKQF